MRAKACRLLFWCFASATFAGGQEKQGHVRSFFDDSGEFWDKFTEESEEPKKFSEDCTLDKKQALQSYETVEEFDRCAPFLLPDYARHYFEGAAGRAVTLKENKRAYRRLQILPRMLRDVSGIDLCTTVLKDKISMPIGADPVALQRLASDLGELDTARAIAEAGTFMILSSLASTTIEDVANAAPSAIKWMQTYIFPEREMTLNLVRRAEAAGFRAIVVTVDSPKPGPLPMKARAAATQNPANVVAENLKGTNYTTLDASLTFQDLAWLVKKSKLPVIAKGILRAEDAILAARYGAKGILVSNHGGRQLDYTPATIEVLPNIVDALKYTYPGVEVYVDGGVRNGYEVFKALARGAKAVLIGRPIVWGLAVGGEDGVRKVLNILRTELKDTMILAGTPTVHSIDRTMVLQNSAINYLH